MKQKLMLFFCLLYGAFAHAQSWNLTGNGGTNPTTDFVGTTDTRPLRFGVNNQRYGMLDNLDNVIFGRQALQSPAGTGNVAIGGGSLSTNTTGASNVAIGSAMGNSTGGNANIAIGGGSLSNNTTGSINVAIGNLALTDNTTGRHNIALGYMAAHSNNTGTENIALGHYSLLQNKTESYLIGIGYGALKSATSETSSIAIGYEALTNSINGGGNIALGEWALRDNSWGIGNVALGGYSLRENINGYGNTGVGSEALIHNIDGDYNTACGMTSLVTNESGSINTAIGMSADVLYDNLNNASAFGAYAIVDGDNKIMIGNPSVTDIGGYSVWYNYSDARYKRNVKENVPGLEFITKLRPVTYTVAVDEINKHYDDIRAKNGTNKTDSKTDATKPQKEHKPDTGPASKIIHTGFLAQEVEKSAQEVNYDFDGVGKPAHDGDLYSLGYSAFVPPLVKAVQEQQLQIEALETQNSELQQVNSGLVKRLERLEQLVNAPTDVKDGATGNNTQLQQNNPNPFSAETVINYTIAENGNVSLQLFDMKGTKVMDMENGFKEKGAHTYTLDGSRLQAGTYYYTLTLNSKRLVKKAIKL